MKDNQLYRDPDYPTDAYLQSLKSGIRGAPVKRLSNKDHINVQRFVIAKINHQD
jgi:hypothetical protein